MPSFTKIVSHNKNIDSVRYASQHRIDSTPPFKTFMNILDSKPSDHRRGYWKYSVGSTFNFSRITIFSFIAYGKLKNNDQTYSKKGKSIRSFNITLLSKRSWGSNVVNSW